MVEKVVYRMTDDMIAENPFINEDGHAAFYNWIQEQLFGGPDNIESIDCRKICVAKNIQESWFDAYREYGKSESELAMTLLGYGPKADESLDDNCVSFEQGAVTVKKASGWGAEIQVVA